MLAISSFLGSAVAAAMTLAPAWKWQLGLCRVGPALATIAIAAGALGLITGGALGLATPPRALIGAGLTLLGAVAVLAQRFYRDPERTVPFKPDIVVSPADGHVVYVRRSQDGRLPVSTKHGHSVALTELTRTGAHDGDAIVVGIGMSFLDVHVNRAPIAGRVLLRRHFPGRFGSLRDPEMVFENERATTLIAGRDLEVAVVQIASRLVRQIAGYVGEGADVELGQRIGVIRLGSQVDLVLPDRSDMRVMVRAGDHVQAGTTVIATVAQPADSAVALRPHEVVA